MYRIAVILIVLLVVMSPPAVVANTNLLTNGDFETGDLTGWTKDSPNATIAAVDTVRPASGAYSFHFDIPSGTVNAPHYSDLHQQWIMQVSDPHLYADVYLESWAGNAGTVTVNAMLRCYNSYGDEVAQIYYGWINTTSWGTGIHSTPYGNLYVLATNMGNTTGVWSHLAADIPAEFDAQFGPGTYASLGIYWIDFLFQTWSATNSTSRVAGYADNIWWQEGPRTSPCVEAPIGPTDGEQGVDNNVTLQWHLPSADPNAIHYIVDYSTDPNLNLPGTQHIQTAVGVTSAQPAAPLSYETDYYWRVNSVDPNNVVLCTSQQWSFKTGAHYTAAVLVSPTPSGTGNVEVNADLRWNSDPDAEKHKVYFGLAGETLTLRSIQTAEVYNPYSDPNVHMAWGTNYEWRIDELVGGSTIVTGNTWNFTTHVLQCVPPLLGDIDGSKDCVVDFADFAVMASEWLSCDWDRTLLSPCP